MNLFKNKAKVVLGLGLASILALQACNKEFEDIAQPVAPSAVTGATIYDVLKSDTSFTFFKAAVDSAGLATTLSNSQLQLTLFAFDNNAFRASGIPSIAVMNAAFPKATLSSIINYNLSPQVVKAAQVPATFPNIQYPTFLNPAPSLSPFLRLTTFPSKRGSSLWVNNIPLVATDIAASNGVIHKAAGIVAPPSKSVYEIITADTTLSYLAAALARADSGRTSIAGGSFTEIAKSIGANITLFAPTNQAFRDLFGAMGLPLSPAVFGLMPVDQARGIAAYHFLGVRAYSVNMPTTPTFIPTFLNLGVPTHPGVNVTATFTGPFVTTFKVTGVGNRGFASNVTTKDINATNGVVHKIDMVLLPQ